MSRTILLTGGGTAGHVTPNLALLPQLRDEGWEIHYMGTVDGIEHMLVSVQPDITYHVVTSGKLRRYFSLKNFVDPFKVIKGFFQARRAIKAIKPDVLFSKGGYVSVPVVLAAKSKTPIVIHESDYSPGLANRICAKFADRICVTFEDTLKAVGKKGVHTGTPIRPELYSGEASKGLAYAGFDGSKPVLLVMGGSLGATAINDAVRASLDRLLAAYDIIHICGSGKIDPTISQKGYVQFEYLVSELPDVLAAADIVLSRAGANAIFEFLALSKPALLIPLPARNSRGDQILNAGYFARKGYALVLNQEDMNTQTLCDALAKLMENRNDYIEAMASDPLADGTKKVLEVIRQAAGITDNG